MYVQLVQGVTCGRIGCGSGRWFRGDLPGLRGAVDNSEDKWVALLIEPHPLKLARLPLLVVVAGVILAQGCSRKTAQPQDGDPVVRVIATTPSSTELVVAAGGQDRLVGRDRYSDYPPAVRSLPVVGDFMSPNIEAILQLEPDLVVMDSVQGKAAEALARGGIRTLVLDMHSSSDVLAGLEAVGKAMGTEEKARAAADRLRAAVAGARARARDRARAPRVLLVIDREIGSLRGIVTAASGSFLHELTTMVGGDNVLAGAAARYPRVSPETILEVRPEVILDAAHTRDFAQAARDWQVLEGVPAVQSQRIHPVGASYFVSPGPRLDTAIAELEALLFPSDQDN